MRPEGFGGWSGNDAPSIVPTQFPYVVCEFRKNAIRHRLVRFGEKGYQFEYLYGTNSMNEELWLGTTVTLNSEEVVQLITTLKGLPTKG